MFELNKDNVHLSVLLWKTTERNERVVIKINVIWNKTLNDKGKLNIFKMVTDACLFTIT